MMMMRAGAAAGTCANGSGRTDPCARCPRLTPTSTPLTHRPQAFGGGRSDGNGPASPHPGYSTDRARTLLQVQEQPQKQDATKDVVRADSMAGPGSSPLYRRGTVCAVVLGGGESDSRRLFPLTKNRTLPAIPVGSVFRLIDIPISNLLNSGINKIYVLTQYNSTSLNRYLHSTYNYTGLPTALGGFVETVAATQGPQEQRWAESAADTVRQWYNLFANSPHLRLIEDVLVLPSDQVYRMDFEELINFHRANDADLTLVCQPVRESDADHFGIMKLEGCDIVTFEEKPRGEAASNMSMDFMDLSELLSEPHLNPGPNLEPRWKKLKNLGSSPGSKTFIGSCGMYIFKKDSMRDLLNANPQARDFGSELIPAAVKAGMKVSAFLFPDYFVDVGGSIQEYYNFNISLAKQQVPFSFTEDVCNEKPFYSSSSQLPPNVYERVKIQGAMLGTGCTLTDCTITNSVVGSRSFIGSGTVIEDSIVMGSDYFEHEKSWSRQVGPSFPPMGIGTNCTIKRAIVDKNSRIGNDVKLVNTEGVYESMDRMARGIAIRDGIIIVSKSSVVPDGTVV